MRTKIGPFGTHSPLSWVEGWNRLSLNLQSFTKTVYGTDYIECRRITVEKEKSIKKIYSSFSSRIQIHANCRIRRIFFADRVIRITNQMNDFYFFFSFYILTLFNENENSTNDHQEYKEEELPLDYQIRSRLESKKIQSSTNRIKTEFIAKHTSAERNLVTPQGSMMSDVSIKEQTIDPSVKKSVVENQLNNHFSKLFAR